MSGKVAYLVITYQDETLFELDGDSYYTLYYILHYIILYYIILYYIYDFEETCNLLMFEKRLLSSLNGSKSVKECEENFDYARIEKNKNYFNELRDRFFKSKIKDIRKDLYSTKSK